MRIIQHRKPVIGDNEPIHQYLKIFDKNALLFFLLIFGTDVVYIFLDIFESKTNLLGISFLLSTERGYAESFQYLKFFWVIILFVYLTKFSGTKNYIAWVILFLYLLCDDALQIHEKLGKSISQNFGFTPPFNLRLRDFGELAISSVAGAILLPILIFAFRTGDTYFRRLSKDLFILIICLLFFGVFIDIIDIALNIGHAGALIEDGGEMIVCSLILLIVINYTIKGGKYYASLFDSIFMNGKKL